MTDSRIFENIVIQNNDWAMAFVKNDSSIIFKNRLFDRFLEKNIDITNSIFDDKEELNFGSKLENESYLLKKEEIEINSKPYFLITIFHIRFNIILLENPVYEISTTGFLVLSKDKIYANQQFIDSLKLTEKVDSYVDIFNKIHPNFRQKLTKRYKDRLLGKKVKDEYEFKYFTAEGNTFTLKTHVVKIDFNGEKAFLYSFKIVKFDLEKENSTIQNVWRKQNSVSNEVFWEYNNIDKIIFTSKTFSRLLDSYNNRIPFKAFLRLIHPADFQKMRFLLDRIVENRQRIYQMELRIKRNKTYFQWFLLKGVNVHKSSGNNELYGTLMSIHNYLVPILSYMDFIDSFKKSLFSFDSNVILFKREGLNYKLKSISSKFSVKLGISSLLIQNMNYLDFISKFNFYNDNILPDKVKGATNVLTESGEKIEVFQLNLEYLLFILHDDTVVTEKEKISTLQNLKQSQIILLARQYFNSIINSINFGVIVLKKNYDLMIYNDVAYHLYTTLISPNFEEVKNINDLKNPLLNHFLASYLDLALKGDETQFIKSVESLSDGVKWLQFNLRPNILPNQEVEEIVITIIDITEHKFNELNILKAKSEAIKADKLKTQFLSNMSHEIRTPMNAIIGFSELLQMELKSPEYLEYLDIIIRSGRELLTLIEDIIDISKIESGEIKLNEKEVNLNEFLSEVYGYYKKIIDSSDKKIRLLLSRSLSQRETVVYIDDLKLRQILNNLVNNAIKFTEEGYIEISSVLNSTKDELVFYVKDTGIGIPKEKQKIIFERFAQADGSVKRNYGGTGLGLAITKGLIEMMGGELFLVSEENQGSTFSFNLPYSPIRQYIPKLFQEEDLMVDWSKYFMLILNPDRDLIYQIKDKYFSTRLRIISTSSISTTQEILKNSKINLLLFSDDFLGDKEFHKLQKYFTETKTICIFRDASNTEMQNFLNYNIDDFCLANNIESTLTQILKKVFSDAKS